MNEDDEEFNFIQPSLIQQLKAILDQYPDDGQILKVRNVEGLRNCDLSICLKRGIPFHLLVFSFSE